jgi:lysophospholipase L1-like esterase
MVLTVRRRTEGEVVIASDNRIVTPVFHRYVALGDSGTEGVGDPRPDGSERGWADRLAEFLGEANPQLLYANLAVRGRRAAEVHEEQLGPALAMEPDLVTVVAGINDVLRPRLDLDTSLEHMDEVVRALRASGATVVTATFPDVSPINPMGRLARKRLLHFNAGIRDAAARRDALLVEAEDFPSLADKRMWCDDRLHLSPEGHRGLASATARVLGVADIDYDLPTSIASQRRRVTEELRWARTFLMPWIGRRLTGRSSGDGRSAKRPHLQPLTER